MTPLEYLEATVPGRPIAWARTGTGSDGKRHNPKRYADWKAQASVRFAAAAKLRRFPGEVSAVVDVWPDRVTVTVAALDPGTERRPGSGLRGDVDNYAKAALDALQAAGTLTDDAQVVDLRVRIRRDANG